ncbi:MAG: transketolase, partial [Planctomyces sp.]
EKFRAFGVTTSEVNGHDQAALSGLLSSFDSDGQHVVIARTIKGRGVSFMEDRMEWHYRPMTEEQYQQAVREQTIP